MRWKKARAAPSRSAMCPKTPFVQHLKDYCQKFLVSNLNWDNILPTYTFAHQHNAKPIIDVALRVITANMDKLTGREEYAELKERHPGLVLEIYEAHFSRAAAVRDQSSFSCVRRASSRSRRFTIVRGEIGNQPQV
ncbi:BTB/POZ domain-containing protein [Prunus yedoensis var. nudiflora]|uniref:BTB/POZ domain-containing protein n=1 Tax=Prunus yedoensis var. nudiflora TaxID=2094558 RepID=A0A314YDA3_PRUYE|nr:BTB/POZ domain-containing protein [Prunus yedoensis var. nudiflora]